MRSIAVHAFAFVALTLTVLSTAALHGNDAVDAMRPANVGDVEVLLRRIEQLERRIAELEARSPVTAPALPHPPVTTLPHVPPGRNDGVLRADQVKIYHHYRREISDGQTAEKSRQAIGPAQYDSQVAVSSGGSRWITLQPDQPVDDSELLNWLMQHGGTASPPAEMLRRAERSSQIPRFESVEPAGFQSGGTTITR